MEPAASSRSSPVLLELERVDAEPRGDAWGLPAGCEDHAAGENCTLVSRSTGNAASVVEEPRDGTAHADAGAVQTGVLRPGWTRGR